ncbi:tRNA (adenosine(37)-N6)-threonylcarbamoyltransferase complex dimerization subunit type 1 TsaB [Geomonas sp. RF6]|uniref:tRNA (adenosine(37)-N6)-threonylcarbamoyltransferase complex dimerization subunit type 1 TsaB n=1 Tax=Geomonas sp. RF6 TaxID=2897342 RepID=UPI001E43E51C|nr:tRNA (adenosine(37)-N6)-threonylcarbamoyltransferase complex dimerization subunit type 1 TsaB [Geomonas sp. RF6]UFS68900.1 tRNA (adenosine(37)-N6)-threonylcarbamoyltransferase complex dimerization subunit type 1 TsaB [Geomonas sp. RF6]
MKILTFDTSGSSSSVALSHGTELIGETLFSGHRTPTGKLLDAARALLDTASLAPADLDAFAVSLGPGSFTGVRVGISLVKGMALAAGKPALGFSSLAMLAANLPLCAWQVAPLFDARKSEVYCALYRTGSGVPVPVAAEAVLPPVDFLATITEPTVFVGDGALRYRELITETLGDLAIFAPWNAHLPKASAGALVAHEAALAGAFIPLAQLNPRYLRLSEAEVAKKRASEEFRKNAP